MIRRKWQPETAKRIGCGVPNKLKKTNVSVGNAHGEKKGKPHKEVRRDYTIVSKSRKRPTYRGPISQFRMKGMGGVPKWRGAVVWGIGVPYLTGPFGPW